MAKKRQFEKNQKKSSKTRGHQMPFKASQKYLKTYFDFKRRTAIFFRQSRSTKNVCLT
jgi:hypothetical protein